MKHIYSSSVGDFFTEEGIVYFHAVDPNPTLEAYREHFRQSKQHFIDKGEQLPMPALVYNESGQIGYGKEVRDYMATAEFAEFSSASAIVANSFIVRVAVNLFLRLTRTSCPMQMFSDKEKGLQWLQQYKK